MRRLVSLLVLMPLPGFGQSFPEGCWLPSGGMPTLLLSEETATLVDATLSCEKGEDLWRCACPEGGFDLVRRNDVTLDLTAAVPACGLPTGTLRLHRHQEEACE